MAKVRVLPEVLAHQIAAGEIIERPASVVKELVENALDAKATQIIVDAEEGGKRLIRVRDNGFGMSAEDARLAFEHHATSKIASFDDLLDVRTLGFRGEALPSIASVSRTRLRTIAGEEVEEGSIPGCEIEYAGGTRQAMRQISWPKGTELTVEDLFFNVPARRKFLKTVPTELSHISRLVTNYAMACPAVEFRLTHQGKKLVNVHSVKSLGDRVFQLLGDRLVENLVELEYEKDGIQIGGFASLPHEQRNNANALYLFVNGRMVRDRVLTHAIRLSYRNLIPTAAYPVVVLFVELNPRRIDINVHPTKVEIRFHESQKVHSAVFHAIERALLLNRRNLSSLARDISFQENAIGFAQRGLKAGQSHPWASNHPQLGSGFPFSNDPPPATGTGNRLGSGGESRNVSGGTPFSAEEVARYHTDTIPETEGLSEIPRVLGQFVESFIVVVDRDGVMLVDQHVAHERILYDSALKALDSASGPASQGLLLPATVPLTPAQKAMGDTLLEHLNRNGFEVDWFGEDTFAVRAVPALAKEIDARVVVEDLLHELETLGRLDSSDTHYRRLREKIAITLSCRAAIKINTPLSQEKMQWLIDQLFHCSNPFTCPHGRPVVLKLTLPEILKAFKRI